MQSNLTTDVMLSPAKEAIVHNGAPMRFFETHLTISATPQKIWKILTDAAKLQDGFGILRIDGQITRGARLKLWSEVAPDRAFPLRVTSFTPPLVMIWQGGMPLGLFTGTRVFTLAPLTKTQTDFTMREDYTGLLAPLIFPKLPDLTPSFRKFADALQKAAES